MQLDLFLHAKINTTPEPVVRLNDGSTVSYTLKRSLRAKNVWLRIGIGTGLEVVVPAGMSAKELGGVLERKQAWIQSQMVRIGHHQGTTRGRVLRDGAMLPLLGEERRLRVLKSRGQLAAVKLVDGEIVAAVADDSADTLKSALESWYRNTARKEITRRVLKLQDGRNVGRIAIKDQKTRWGSCSSKGNLNFNWRLVMAPPRIIDYLILHELAHLECPNHSKRFWDKLRKICPDYEKCDLWLKENGRNLTLA
jgi:predicted metal-dependent hydrolase